LVRNPGSLKSFFAVARMEVWSHCGGTLVSVLQSAPSARALGSLMMPPALRERK